MNDKFDLSPDIVRTRDERIDMVTDPECPLDVVEIVAEFDTEDMVIEACAYHPKASNKILSLVEERTGKTRQELLDAAHVFEIKNRAEFKNSFCTVPWNHAGTNADGNVRMCCQMIYGNGDKSYGNVFKDDGTPLSAADDDITENRNAPNWKELRAQFLKGKRPAVCKLCWDEEDNGIGSRRQFSLNAFPEVIEDAILKTEEDGIIKHDDFPITWWDLRFGNKCNLKCRSCGPTDSDQWYGDWVALGKGNTFDRKQGEPVTIKEIKPGRYEVEDVFNWYDDSKLYDHIVDNLDEAKMFYFTGGEPTINRKHKELLQIMIDRDLAKDMVIEYNTNMAGVPDKIFDQWENFKQVNLGMSIDGIYEHFEYIRHPGKWRAAERNMRRVDRDPRLDNAIACVTVTLSIMNVLHILDMMWWMKEQNWQRIDSNLIAHNLYGPKFYNIQNLPEGMKDFVERQYKQFINDCNRRWPEDREWNRRTEDTLNSIMIHMRGAKCDENEWKLFLQTSKELDEVRGEKWTDSLPEIAEAYKKYNDTKQRKRKVELETANKRRKS